MGKDYRTYSKTTKVPRRPYEKERLDRELKLCGEFGLANKRECWRVAYAVAKEDVVNKWSKTTVARRLEKQTNKRNSTDLERWRIQHNRRQRSYLIKVKFNKLKKRAQKIAEEKHAKKSKRERPAKVKKTEKKKKDLPKKSPEAPPAKAKKTSKKGDASKKAKGKQLSAHEEEVFTNAKINFKAMHAWQGRCLPGEPGHHHRHGL